MNTFIFKIARKWSAIPFLAAACVFGSVGSACAADLGGGTTVFGGIDAREKANYSYAGLIHNFSGDILANGVLVRLVGLNANYSYSTTAVTGGSVKGRATLLEALVGYQKVYESYALRGYVGLDYETNRLSPDNTLDSNRGTHSGGKVRGEFETNFSAPNYVALMASYGSANARYWAMARAGRDFNGYVVGPEALAMGDREYREHRIGVFLTSRKILPAMFTVSAGASNSKAARAGVAPYMAIALSTTF